MMNAPTVRDGGVASARGWVTVALLLVAATLVSMLLDQHVALMSQAMIYVLAVVIASYRLRWIESVVCAVGAVTALNFFFVPPRAGPWSLKIANSSSGWRPCTGREHAHRRCLPCWRSPCGACASVTRSAASNPAWPMACRWSGRTRCCSPGCWATCLTSLKYRDGTIDLTVGVASTVGGAGASANGQELEIAVKDRGPGVPEADQETIFEPYARGEQSGHLIPLLLQRDRSSPRLGRYSTVCGGTPGQDRCAGFC